MHLTRRDFVRAAGAAGLGLAAVARAQDDTPTPVPRRKIPRLDLEVPILAMGFVNSGEASVVLRAMEWNMNLVHTMGGYGGGKIIQAIADAMKERPREDFIIGLGTHFEDGGVERDLETLETDHADLLFYATGDAGDAKSDDVRKKCESFKEQGLTKGVVLTTHENIPEILEAGLEADWWDGFMPAYYPANADQIDPIMERAEEQRIAGFVMKSWRGVDDPAERRRVWAEMLSKSHWTSIFKSLENESFVDEMGRFAHSWEDHIPQDGEVGVAARTGVCRLCGNCTRVCERGIAVPAILRYEMYAREYGWAAHAREQYAALAPSCRAEACAACGACSQVCTAGLDIPSCVRRAHRLLA